MAGTTTLTRPHQQHVLEDATTAYLQMIGRHRLLDRDLEEQYGIDCETGVRLCQLAKESDACATDPDGAVTVAATAYRAVLDALPFLGEWVRIPADLYRPEVRALIDGQPDDALAAEGARRTGQTVAEIQKLLVRLSTDTRLLPPHVLCAISKATPCSTLSSAIPEQTLTDALRPFAPELARRWRRVEDQANRSAERMVESNLRLVVSIARRYLGRGLPLLDLIQEGNTGLMQAVKRFDYRRGRKFSTYATWWIRQAVLHAVADRGRMIRLPVHRVDAVRRVERARDHYLTLVGEEPTAEEIGTEIGLSPEEAQGLLRDAIPVMSLDIPILEDESGTVGDTLPSADDLEDRTITSLMTADLASALTMLPERERRIIQLRYGLEGEEPRTLADVGRVLGISRERARQLEERGLRILRRQPALAASESR